MPHAIVVTGSGDGDSIGLPVAGLAAVATRFSDEPGGGETALRRA